MSERCKGVDCEYLQRWAEDKGKQLQPSDLSDIVTEICSFGREKGMSYADGCPPVELDLSNLEVQDAQA